jgi:hypothetical protein
MQAQSPRKNQRFVLFWVIFLIVVALGTLGAFTVVNGRNNDAAQRARINAIISTPTPHFAPGTYYP